MFKILSLFLGAKSLAGQWQVLARMAVTMARHVLRLEVVRPKQALQKAEMLEAWCVCALTEVTKQIDMEDRAVHLARPFSQQLPPVACILLCLMRVILRLRATLALRPVFIDVVGFSGPCSMARRFTAPATRPP